MVTIARRPGIPGGCGHLVAGTTRVWETIAGGNATMNAASWYVTNNPSTQNMTKQTLGNRSFINQVKYSPKWSSQAIVGTNDANVWIGFNLGTGTASQANWVNVTGDNTVLPNRPVLGIALDAASPNATLATGYAAVGGFNANTPATPGHVFQVTCAANCATFTWANKTGNLPDIPVDSIIVNHNDAGAGLRRHRLGRVLHRRHHRRLADLVPVRGGHAAFDGLGPPDRPRRDDALGLDARPRRVCVAAAGRWASASASSAATTRTAASTAATTAAV